MDNYFKWLGICIAPTELLEYADNNKTILLVPGELIKVSPQSMQKNEIRLNLIILYNKPVPGDNEVNNDKIYLCPDTKFELVHEEFWPYVMVETNSLYRLNVYRKRTDILSLKTGEMINIYLNSPEPNQELKVSCTIEYIGEVPEYGKGVNFCLRAMNNVEFVRNPQTNFIGKYAKGSRTSLIIVLASAFFEVSEFDDITSRPIVLTEAPKSINPVSDIEKLQAQFNELKQRLAGANSGNIQPNNSGAIRKTFPENVKQSTKMSLQFNSVSLACSICRKECPASSGILLANCGHVFCYDCLINHINSVPGDIQICPFINKKYKCSSIIQLYELNCLNSDEAKAFIAKNRNNSKASTGGSAKKDAWDCSKCTFENSLKATKCSICNEPRAFQPVDYAQCINCFDTCSQARIFTLLECNHSVCNNCLMIYLEYQLNGVVDNVVCPIKFCDYVLKSKDILEMFIQLERFYIKNVTNYFDVCVSCQVTHSKVTCKQFQQGLMSSRDPVSMRLREKYDQLVGIGDAAPCPKCHLVIIKQGHEKEYCLTCEFVFKSGFRPKPWYCGICCNPNDRDSNICGVCGKSSKNKAKNKMPATNCMFCTLEINFSNGVTLNCSHFFCKDCLESLVRSNETVLRCPYEQNNNKCSASIEDYEVVQIMGAQMYKQYKIRLVRDVAKQTENSVLCLDQNCTGWSLKDDLYDSNMFICTVCRQPNCLACNVVHAGMTCAVYNDPVKREQYLLPKPQQYNDLVKMDDDQVIKNTEPFECPICYLEFGVGEAVVLRECLHVFCKDCLTNHVKHTDGVEAKCPFVDNDYKCESIILEREIKAVVDEQTYNQYIGHWYTIGKNNIEHGVQCNTVNCDGFWENDGNINEQECPLCKAVNCLNCQAIHPDMKCDEYQTSIDTKKKLEDEIARGIGMRCPKCKIIIVRTEGCDWLQCTMCRTEICWVTKGARWGPNGKGDTSGGCRCRVNGQMCHKNCMNCH